MSCIPSYVINALTGVTNNSYHCQLKYLADKHIHESFVGFFELDEDLTGESIAAITGTALPRWEDKHMMVLATSQRDTRFVQQ